jgi:hypothetical protein
MPGAGKPGNFKGVGEMYKILRTWYETSGEDVGQFKVELVDKYDSDVDARHCFDRTKLSGRPGEQISLAHNGNFLCGKV